MIHRHMRRRFVRNVELGHCRCRRSRALSLTYEMRTHKSDFWFFVIRTQREQRERDNKKVNCKLSST